MTEKFLEKTARYLLERHPGNLHTVCVVVPGRRANLYLKRYLSQIAGRALLLPDIFTIEEFIFHLSGYTKVEPLELLFELYQIHKNTFDAEAEDLGDFLPFGMMLLNDFNEVDMHMVDARSLYHYLSEAKAIERWNPSSGKLSPTTMTYLQFYRSLHEYYQKLRSRSAESGSTYQGMAFRHVAENIETLLQKIPWSRLYFTGFNALTVSEKIITRYLVSAGKAEMLFDADTYYLRDRHHEAGYHLRRDFLEKDRLKPFQWEGNYFDTIGKKIFIVGTPGNYGQTIYAAEQISQWIEKETSGTDPLSDCAVILTDENFLFPLLNNLPEAIPLFNVTMGYPLRQTLAAQLFMQILRTYENVKRFAGIGNNPLSRGFYHHDISALCCHPFLNHLPVFQAIHSLLITTTRVFYRAQELLQPLQNNIHSPDRILAETIFLDETPETDVLIEKFKKIFHLLVTMHLSGSDYPPAWQSEISSLLSLEKLFRWLEILQSKYHEMNNLFSLRKVFQQMLAVSTIPFEGEPLHGLQVMGLLETRALDFRKIIVLAANEGILPRGQLANTLIPYDIRREFGLPGIYEQNAVTAYHFYRLLQRASEIHLVYNTEADDLGGGEPSRFILQLEHELPLYQPAHSIQRKLVSFPLPAMEINPAIIISKNQEILNILVQLSQTGLSVSAINQYRMCPLKFYFTHILKIADATEVEESMEAKTLGTIVHETLENLYKPFLHQTLQPENFAEMEKRIDETIQLAIDNNYKSVETDFGWNRLLREVIRNFVAHWIQFEAQLVAQNYQNKKFVTILDLEKTLETDLEIELPFKQRIHLRGTLDRVDEFDQLIRISDYKTGRVDNSELSFDTWETLQKSPQNEKAFQLLMYNWLYLKINNTEKKPISSGLISLRKPNNGFMTLKISDQPDLNQDLSSMEMLLGKFETWLKEILSELLDPALPFAQTDNLKTCRYCDFRNICRR